MFSAALKGDMLVWVILYHGFYKGLAWHRGNTSNINISCYPLWVGSVDGLPSLYEGFLTEMDAPWEWTDIDFFIPKHTLMYRLFRLIS